MSKDAKGARPQEYKSTVALGTVVSDEEQGIVEHIFAVFGNVDYAGDIIQPGAFKKTLQERGLKVRVLDSHNMFSVMDVIGRPLQIREIGRDELPPEVLMRFPEATGGAWARTQFLLNTDEGRGAFIRIKEGAIDEWSFGFDVIKARYEEKKLDDGTTQTVRVIEELRLWEYSPVLWGANPATTTLDAKEAKGSVEPEESKPVEETDDYIRVRVRLASEFEEGSFRTIDISKTQGIKAVIGRLKGKTSTTVQAYLFDKEKGWTVAKAKAWVEEHGETIKESAMLKRWELKQKIIDLARELLEELEELGLVSEETNQAMGEAPDGGEDESQAADAQVAESVQDTTESLTAGEADDGPSLQDLEQIIQELEEVEDV